MPRRWFNDGAWRHIFGDRRHRPVGAYRDEVLADSPIAYWRLDDSATPAVDETGNGHDADVYTSAYTSQTTTAPTWGTMALIDAGMSSDFERDDMNGLAPENDAAFDVASLTIEAWIKVESSSIHQKFFVRDDSKGPSSEERSFAFMVVVSTGTLRGLVFIGGTPHNVEGTTLVDDRGVYHVVMTYDSASGDLLLYVNGVRDGSENTGGGDVDSAAIPPGIGFQDDANSGLEAFFDGLIDEVAFYGAALSGDRIVDHYNAGRTEHVIEAAYSDEVLAENPFAYWRLEETSGSTLVDETGDGWDGTVTGANLDTVGKVGSAISYDGVDDYTDHTKLGTFGESIDQTWECWLRTTTTAQSTLTGTFNDGSNTGVQLNLNLDSAGNNTAGALRVFHRFEEGAIRGTVDNPTVDWRDGIWHHLVWRIESSVPEIRVWLDGEEQTFTVNDSSAITSFASYQYPLTWGARNNRATIDDHADVDVDEPAIYGKLIPPHRIKAHYDAAQ